MQQPNRANVIETLDLTKVFPGVVALNKVSIQVETGTCHALVGENGAGKSTLGKIIGGLYRPDQGHLLVDGKPVSFAGPLQATRAGISLVHQELLFCENLSVAENLCLDEPPAFGPLVDPKEMIRRSGRWLKAMQVDVDPNTLVGALTVSMQQQVQIAGAVGKGARVLIFDEPTSSLTQREVDLLFEQIRRLKKEGVTCLYVSHRLEEIFAICDRVTVLRDGCHVGTEPIENLDRNSIVRMMIGRDILRPAPRQNKPAGEPLLQVEGLSSPGKFHDVSFEVRAGEILGLAGLVGAGRTEIAQAIFGLDRDATGTVRVKGRAVRPKSPSQMMAHGVGLVPEDRKRHGLVLMMNSRENISLAILDQIQTLGFTKAKQEREIAALYFEAMRVKAPSLDTPVAGLSGGNQQKLVIAKWLAAKCDVLILDEPTRGVDVGAKSEIYALIRELADQGKAVIVISSELPELLSHTDRILALYNGRITGERKSIDATEESLLRLMTGSVDKTEEQRNQL